MCIHKDYYREKYDNHLKAKKSNQRTVSLRSRYGYLIAAWPANYSDAQIIANTIRDLKSWHPNYPGAWVDLREINEARLANNLEALDNEGLPFAIGEPLSQDLDVDLILTESGDYTEFEEGLRKYAEAQRLQLQNRVPVMVGA